MSWKSCSTDSHHHHDRSSVKTKHLSSKQQEGAKNRKIFVHPDALVGWPGRTAIASLTCIRAQNKLLIHISNCWEKWKIYIFLIWVWKVHSHCNPIQIFAHWSSHSGDRPHVSDKHTKRERESRKIEIIWEVLCILIRKLSIRWTQIFYQKMYADSIFLLRLFSHNQEFRFCRKYKHSKI